MASKTTLQMPCSFFADSLKPKQMRYTTLLNRKKQQIYYPINCLLAILIAGYFCNCLKQVCRV